MIEASCHCGAVRPTVGTAPAKLTACNCSICRRYDALWAYYPSDQVEVSPPSGATEVYMWGERGLEFHRCAGCGCVTHWASADPAVRRVAVNARLMEPEVVDKAKVRRFDGARSWTYLDDGGA